MSETSLTALVKEIGEALLLDGNNNDQAAYKMYVTCIYKISTNLILALRLAGGNVVADMKTSKQVKLMQQCVERVITLLDKMESSKSKSIGTAVQSALSAATVSPAQSVVGPHNVEDLRPDCQTSPTACVSVQVSSNVSGGPAFGAVRPEPSLVIEKSPYTFSVSRSHSLTPMEIARKQNQSLRAAYKARMERLNRSDFNAFNYSLTIQRKMAENIAIARGQEEELARKMQARNLRLEQEAAKRFATPMGMSKEEQEQRQIYKRILEYENEAKWLKNWRIKLEASPEDPILISQLVQEILRCSDHPFTELLQRYQFQIYQRLYPLVANRHQEIDVVQVPLPLSVWPSLEDVSEIFSDNIPSPQSPVAVKLSRNLTNTRMSKMGREASVEKGGTSQQGSGDNDAAKPRTEDPEAAVSHLCHVESQPASNGLSEGLSSQANDVVLQSATGSQKQPEAFQSENIDADSRNESVAEPHSSPTPFQGGHVSCELSENMNPLTCDQQTGTDSKGNDQGHVESGGTGEALLSDDVSVAAQLSTNAEEEHELHRLNSQTEQTTESTSTAQVGSAEPTSISQKDSSDYVSAIETQVEAPVMKNVSSRPDARLISDTDKGLETQMSWERRQAQILMRQVTKDYNGYRLGDSDYDENNLDYLFDDDEDGEDGYGWLIENEHLKAPFSQVRTSAPELVMKTPGPNVDRSVSITPATTRSLSYTDDVPPFQSLPTNLDGHSKSGQDKEFDKLRSDAYQRHLQSISDDIHRYLEKLLVMMTIAYEPLDTPIGKDQCAVSLEEPFFKPIWKTLFRLFRVVNHRQELVLAGVMTKLAGATPEEFRVSKKLWLTDGELKPYQSAVSELINVKEHYTMLSKLECVVKVCRLICECVDEYYSQQGGQGSASSKKAPSVGADDLLPILTYVIVQSGIPQLSSECHAMTEFIDEGYMMGEEGYCLTSLRTALSYVISMFTSLSMCDQEQAAAVSQDNV